MNDERVQLVALAEPPELNPERHVHVGALAPPLLSEHVELPGQPPLLSEQLSACCQPLPSDGTIEQRHGAVGLAEADPSGQVTQYVAPVARPDVGALQAVHTPLTGSHVAQLPAPVPVSIESLETEIGNKHAVQLVDAWPGLMANVEVANVFVGHDWHVVDVAL